MKKDLTFNVDDFLKRLETLHHISFDHYDKKWHEERLKEVLKVNPNLEQLDFYHLDGNYLIRSYVCYGVKGEGRIIFPSDYFLITDKFSIRLETINNEINLFFRGHIYFVTDEEIDNIRQILSQFVEFADTDNKITSFYDEPISHELFLMDIQKIKINLYEVCNNIRFINRFKLSD